MIFLAVVVWRSTRELQMSKRRLRLGRVAALPVVRWVMGVRFIRLCACRYFDRLPPLKFLGLAYYRSDMRHMHRWSTIILILAQVAAALCHAPSEVLLHHPEPPPIDCL
jgi:hypothetical protein